MPNQRHVENLAGRVVEHLGDRVQVEIEVIAWLNVDAGTLTELPQIYDPRGKRMLAHTALGIGYRVLLERAPNGFIRVLPRPRLTANVQVSVILSPATPTRIRARRVKRIAEVLSPSAIMPVNATPSVPIPTHTA